MDFIDCYTGTTQPLGTLKRKDVSWSDEQGIENSKLVLEKLKEKNLEVTGTNWNECRYWIGKLPQYVPTWMEYRNFIRNE